jgi:Transglycosylase SLT domain/LysM domain
MASCHRRPRKIRRTGQHAAPSALARKAAWATPVILTAGVLTWTWQWMGTDVPPPGTAAQVVHLNPQTPHHQDTRYTVRPGDTLSTIAQHFYGTPQYWPGLYDLNRVIIGADPMALDAGIVLRVPSRPDARAKTPLGQSHAVYRPQHAAPSVVVPAVPVVHEAPAAPAAPVVPAVPIIPAAPVAPVASAAPVVPAATAAPAAPAATAAPAAQSQPRSNDYSGPGTYSYSGLKRMWTAAGGSPATADRAACIAEHESSGRPNAISPSNCYGLWQEMGRPEARDPATSARIAVSMSHGGTNWSAWSTSGSC